MHKVLCHKFWIRSSQSFNSCCKKASKMHDRYFHPLSTICVHLHSHKIHLYPPSPPVSFIFIHFHPLSVTFIHFINFHPFSPTFNLQSCLWMIYPAKPVPVLDLGCFAANLVVTHVTHFSEHGFWEILGSVKTVLNYFGLRLVNFYPWPKGLPSLIKVKNNGLWGRMVV